MPAKVAQTRRRLPLFGDGDETWAPTATMSEKITLPDAEVLRERN
jgi:hypothetical protein